jgi:hypothetical protein
MTVWQSASGSHFADMRTVGLKTLKNKLSEYVAPRPPAKP